MSQGKWRNKPYYTATQRRILEVLSDGLPHPKAEIYACLSDELGEVTNIHPHIVMLRKKLQARGEDILFVMNRGHFYQHVRFLHYPATLQSCHPPSNT